MGGRPRIRGEARAAAAARGDRNSQSAARWTSAPYKCKNGQDYGIGLIAHIPAPYNGFQTFSGIYAAQDTASAEERAWLCLYATGNFYACTTHLASTSATVALTQCKDLTNTIIPSVRASGGYAPTVLGGDWNLKFHGSPDAQACVLPGYYRKGRRRRPARPGDQRSGVRVEPHDRDAAHRSPGLVRGGHRAVTGLTAPRPVGSARRA